MPGPLSGLRVIEMSALGPVPLAGQLMADQGAEVIVIDRRESPADTNEVNRRNKQSVVLDLKAADGLRMARQLIDTADVLIEGFRPGVMERLGLGPEPLQASNPGLIFGRMTGWGQSGPLAQTAGHDINYLSITGALHAIGHGDEAPVPPLNLVADYGGGAMFLLFGVLSALYERRQSGLGQVVDAAMIEGVPAMMGLIQEMFARDQWQQKRQCNPLDGGAPFYRCYETGDGKYIAVGAIEAQFFRQFIELAGLPLTDVDIQNDRTQWPAMCERYAVHFKRRTRDEWQAVFEGSDACVSPVLNFEEAAEYHHNKERSVFIAPDGVLQTCVVPKFSRSTAALVKVPVGAGENTAEITALLDHTDL